MKKLLFLLLCLSATTNAGIFGSQIGIEVINQTLTVINASTANHTALYNLAFGVSGHTGFAGADWAYNKTDTYNKSEVENLVSSNENLFLSNASSTVAGYDSLLASQMHTPGFAYTTTLTSDGQFIKAFVVKEGDANTTIIKHGLLSLHLYAQTDGVMGAKSAYFSWQLFKRTGATETFIVSSSLSDTIASDLAVETAIATLDSDFYMNGTDRLVLKIFGNVSGGGANPTISIWVEDNYNSVLEFRTTVASLLQDYVTISTIQNITANKGFSGANLTFYSDGNESGSFTRQGTSFKEVLGGNGFGGKLQILASTGSEWFSVGNVAGQVAFNQQGGSTIVATATAMGSRMNIGSLSTTSGALTLSGVAGQTHNIFEINSNGDLGGNLLSVLASGSIGIGTTAPGAKLQVDSTGEALRINSSAVGNIFTIYYGDGTNGVAARFANNSGWNLMAKAYKVRSAADDADLAYISAAGGGYFSNTVLIGSSSSNLTISNIGRLTLAGNARVLKEIVVPVSRLTSGASAPTLTTRAVGASGTVKIPVLSFSKTTEQETYGEIHIPSDNDDSINVSLHLMWIPGAGYTTGNYAWNFTYLVKNDDGDDSVGVPLNVSATVTPTNATQLIETHFATTIDANAQQVIQFRFFRDVAADNADDTGEVRFLEVEYTANKLGE